MSPSLTRLRALHAPLVLRQCPRAGGTKVEAGRVSRWAKRRCPRRTRGVHVWRRLTGDGGRGRTSQEGWRAPQHGARPEGLGMPPSPQARGAPDHGGVGEGGAEPPSLGPERGGAPLCGVRQRRDVVAPARSSAGAVGPGPSGRGRLSAPRPPLPGRGGAAPWGRASWAGRARVALSPGKASGSAAGPRSSARPKAGQRVGKRAWRAWAGGVLPRGHGGGLWAPPWPPGGQGRAWYGPASRF